LGASDHIQSHGSIIGEAKEFIGAGKSSKN
jgi:hypothetical protein